MVLTTGVEASPGASIWAIARRDLLIQLSYQFALLMRLGEILLVGVTLFFISKLVGAPAALGPYRGRYFEFAIVGAIVVSFAVLGLGTFSRTISDEQKAGTLEVLLTTPTRIGTLLAGAFVVPLGLTGLEMVVYFSMAVGLGARFSFSGLLLSLPILTLTALTFCAFGIASAGFIILTKRGDPFTLIGMRAATFLAGSLFPVSLLPRWLQPVAQAVPAYYGLRGIREALLGQVGIAGVLDEVAILVGFVLVMLPLSLLFFSWALRVARSTGTLGTY